MTLIKRIWLFSRDESAEAAVDFALVATGVALAAVTALHNVASQVSHAFLTNGRTFNAVINACMRHHT